MITVEERNRIVSENAGLIQPMISKVLKKKKLHNAIDREDLFQEGIIALINAVRLFDISKNIKFSTYASHAIYQSVTDAINNTYLIRIPHNTNVKSNKVDSRVDLPPHIKAAIKIKRSSYASFDLNYDVAGTTQSNDIDDYVTNMLAKLDDISRKAISLNFGLGNNGPLMVKDIALQFGVSSQSVSSRIIKGLNKLKIVNEKEGL